MKQNIIRMPISKILMYVGILWSLVILVSCRGPLYNPKGCIVTKAESNGDMSKYQCTEELTQIIEITDKNGKFNIGDTLYMSKTKQP